MKKIIFVLVAIGIFDKAIVIIQIKKKSRHWRVFYFCCWRAMNSEIKRSRNAICFFKSRRDAWFKRDI